MLRHPASAAPSLCLMPCLCARCLGSWEALKHEISSPSDVRVTGAEAPSDTDQFARALGVPSRSHLAGNGASGSFNLFPSKAYTDVISVPFEDACGGHSPRVQRVRVA